MALNASPRLRLRAGKQGNQYPHAAGLPGPPQHPIYRALHRAGAWAVQEPVAELTCERTPVTASEIERTSGLRR